MTEAVDLPPQGAAICDASARDTFGAAADNKAALGESILTMASPMPRWKRAVDVIGAATGLLLSGPLIVLAGLLVRATSRGPMFFRQDRVGLGGRIFRIYKLRTMCRDAEIMREDLLKFNERDGLAFKMSNDPRVTLVGRWLRRWSIDELPQFWNVLKGDMSLVGPRPLPSSDWRPPEAWYCCRHEVAPGMTCFWQVRRRRIRFKEWMEMDVQYVTDRSPWTDIKLLAMTPYAVLRRIGPRW